MKKIDRLKIEIGVQEIQKEKGTLTLYGEGYLEGLKRAMRIILPKTSEART